MSAPAPARRAAYEVLRRVFEHGAYADRALPAAVERAGAEGRDRGQAQRLAYGAVRGMRTADWIVERLSPRRAAELDPAVAAALRLGIWELLNSDATPARAAVHEAVELAKWAGAGRGAGFVNAVLRRASSEAAGLVAALEESDPDSVAIRHSFPTWIVRLWFDELGAEDAVSLLRALNAPAETALRANPLRRARDELLSDPRLAAALRRPQGSGLLAGPEALLCPGPLSGPVAEAIEAGELVPQSRASQAAVELLDPGSAEAVLDLCSAPGMKATQIAARQPEAEVVCVESDGSRASQLRELAERLGASALRVVGADAAERVPERDGGWPRILLDPPCSALGTLGSRPDARWRRSPEAITELAALQRRILAGALDALAPGGVLVYSTCTISAVENEDLIAAVLADAEEIEADELGAREPGLASPRDPRFLLTRPDRDRTDGFFFARLRRRDRAPRGG